MVVGIRRRALAAAVTALAAMALAIAVGGRGCGADDDSPEAAASAFAAAARAGDREAMVELVSPATRRRLDELARDASRLVSEKRYRASDMLSLGEAGEPRSFELREQHGDRAVVDVIDDSGRRVPLRLVAVDGRWRVDLSAELERGESGAAQQQPLSP